MQGALQRLAAIMALEQFDPKRASVYAASAVEIAKRAGIPRTIANCTNLLGICLSSAGNLVEGERLQREAIATLRELGDIRMAAWFLGNLGECLLKAGMIEEAEAPLEEALAINGAEDPVVASLYAGSIAVIALKRGELERAGTFLEQGLSYYRRPPYRQPRGLAEHLVWIAVFAMELSHTDAGARLVGAADAIHERLGIEQAVHAEAEYQRAKARLREMLGEDRYHRRWVEGRALSTPDVLDEALSVTRFARRPRSMPVPALIRR